MNIKTISELKETINKKYKQECCSQQNSKIILLEDKKSGSKSKFYIENDCSTEIVKLIVDGCLINEGSRCDYLLIALKIPAKEIYFELKSKSDLDKAIKQIEATIKKISMDKNKINKYCYIIHTGNVRPAVSATLRNQQKRFKNNYNAKLKMQASNSPKRPEKLSQILKL